MLKVKVPPPTPGKTLAEQPRRADAVPSACPTNLRGEVDSLDELCCVSQWAHHLHGGCRRDPALYYGRPLWSGREDPAVLRHVREHGRHRGNERKESNPAAARTAEHSSSQLAETGCRNFAQCSWLRTLFQPNRGGLWHVDEFGARRSAVAKSMSTRLLSNSGGWSIRRV